MTLAKRAASARPEADLARRDGGGISAAAAALLLVTAAISLLRSHYQLLWIDEFLEMQTDRVASLGRLIEVQRHFPISLDPLFYHALAHLSIAVFGATAFALRLPALCGYLLMQACLYLFVRRLYSEKAALLAMALPLLTSTYYYAAEGRPYGLLLGLFGLAMLAWQSAIRREGHRGGTLVLLALALALALNTHYFGVLLLAPICTAEIFRSVERRLVARRAVDWPVAGAIVLGMSGILCALPFERAAAEFKKHYYNVDQVPLRALSDSYLALFADDSHYSARTQNLATVLFLMGMLLTLWFCVVQIRRLAPSRHKAEFVLLFAMAALPMVGFLVARFATHSIEPRYVLGAVVGISGIVAIAITQALKERVSESVLLAIVLGPILFLGYRDVSAARHGGERLKTGLTPSLEVQHELDRTAAEPIYTSNVRLFDFLNAYDSDAALRRRLTLVYSQDLELRFAHLDTFYLTATHMRAVTGEDAIPFESLLKHPHEAVFLIVDDEWDWTRKALAESGVQIRQVGTFAGAALVEVQPPALH